MLGGAAVVAVSLLLAGTAAARLAAPPPTPYLRWVLVDQRAVSGTDSADPSANPIARTRVTFLVPKGWRRLNDSSARYRFDDGRPHNRCWMTITVFDRVAVGSAESPAARLERTVPARSAPYVLDEGTRNGGAWRVVRHPGGAAMTGRYAIRSARFEKRLGAAAPAVWHEVDMTATPGGECHSGRIHAMGHEIGAALASLDREAIPGVSR